MPIPLESLSIKLERFFFLFKGGQKAPNTVNNLFFNGTKKFQNSIHIYTILFHFKRIDSGCVSFVKRVKKSSSFLSISEDLLSKASV